MNRFSALLSFLLRYLGITLWQLAFRRDSMGEAGGGLESMIRNLKLNDAMDRFASQRRKRVLNELRLNW